MVTNLTTGADPGEAIAPLKPAKVTLFTIILYNPENNIRDMRQILPSIVMSQQCCEVHFISLAVAKPV